MMSINLGLISQEKFNCIVGFSGKIIDKEDLQNRKISSPKILLLHGDSDNLVPIEGGIDTKKLIPNAKMEILEGWGHDLPSGVHDWFSTKISNHIYSIEDLS